MGRWERWEGSKLGKLERLEDSKAATLARLEGSDVASWERWDGGRVGRWQCGKGARVVRWQGGKGRRGVKWQGGMFLVLFKSWGTQGEPKISSFCFWCWSAMEQRGRMGSRLSWVATGMEGLSLDLTQVAKYMKVRRYLQFVISGDGCNNWFHQHCENFEILSNSLYDSSNWFCRACQKWSVIHINSLPYIMLLKNFLKSV